MLAGFLPFLIADPGAFYDDTINYGAGTYRIVGYGLSSLLLRAHVVDDRYGYYPFAIARAARLAAGDGVAAARPAAARRPALDRARPAFADLDLRAVFIARVFQTSYLVWPLTGACWRRCSPRRSLPPRAPARLAPRHDEP